MVLLLQRRRPLAMKIDSPDILHKTDIGGVILGVKNALEAEKAYLARGGIRSFWPG